MPTSEAMITELPSTLLVNGSFRELRTVQHMFTEECVSHRLAKLESTLSKKGKVILNAAGSALHISER